MKKVVTLVCMTALLLGAAEHLRNASWAGDLSGWSIRDTRKPKQGPRDKNTKAASVKDGILSIDTDKNRSEVMVIQNNLGLKANTNYNFYFEVKSETDANYRYFVAWHDKDASGKVKWAGTGGVWKNIKGGTGWLKEKITFKTPAYKGGSYCYVAASSGIVRFRNAKLVEAGIEAAPGNDLSVFVPGKPVSYRLWNFYSPENSAEIQIRDFYGKTVSRQKIQGEKEVSFTNLKNGWFEILLKEIDRNGKTVASGRRTFCIIPEVPEVLYTTPNNRFGAMVNPNTYYPLSQRTMDARFMHRLGIRFVRTHRQNWAHIQPSKDKPYDWSLADAEMDLYDQYRLQRISTTGWHVPAWASSADGTNQPGKSMFFPKEECIPELAKFYETMARRYRGRIAAYEIGNEIDAWNFWRGRLKHRLANDNDAIFNDYVELFQIVSSAILRGDPDAKIGPGLTGSAPDGSTFKDWVRRFWKTPAAKNMNIFCSHYKINYEKLREEMRKGGKVVPIYNTEVGGLVSTLDYDKISASDLRQMIKRCYSLMAYNCINDAQCLCKFLLRRIPEVSEGWIAEMMDADYTLRPEYAAYGTLIRLTGNGVWKKELNVTSDCSKGWLQGYRIEADGKTVNLLLLNDTDNAQVTLRAKSGKLKMIDVMGNELPLKEEGNGVYHITMQEDTPVFILGDLAEHPGKIVYPQPKLLQHKVLPIQNAGFEENTLAPWRILYDENSGSGKGFHPSFKAVRDTQSKASGAASVRLESEKQTKWHGIMYTIPVTELPKIKKGEYLVLKLSYDQKGENIVGIGSGYTISQRDQNLRRLAFKCGNWRIKDFPWSHQSITLEPWKFIHPETKYITVEFYLGVSTGKTWIDNVKLEYELYQVPNASAAYVN